jgi:hypothetical protein
MTWKKATVYALLLFVAATCIVLIVKSLPHKQQTPPLAMQDGVKVYYLHANVRCPTCRTIEAFAKGAVETGFPDELKNGKIAWQVVNYETPGNEHFVTDYQVVAPNVVLVKFKDGKQVSWKELSEVWEYVEEKAVFVDFVRKNLREFIQDDSGTIEVVDDKQAKQQESKTAARTSR